MIIWGNGWKLQLNYIMRKTNKMTDYSKVVVKKPWGYEYLVYENSHVALWFLHINYGFATSMHCHPQKTTGLVLLSGVAELSFLADKKIITAPTKEMIRRGLFHSTKALSDDGALIFEIETPNDKYDLVRLNDNYGRASQGYEKSNFEMTRDNSHLWIDDQTINTENKLYYDFADCSLIIEKISSLSDLYNLDSEEIIIFLKGGLLKIVDNILHYATIPGDIARGSILKIVIENVHSLDPETTIMRINNKNNKNNGK